MVKRKRLRSCKMDIVKVGLHSKMCGTIAPSNNNDNCGIFAEESNLLPKSALMLGRKVYVCGTLKIGRN